MPHALVGTLILMAVFNYMTIRGVPGTWQTTVTGFLLLAAMLAGRLLQRGGPGDLSASEVFRDEFVGMTARGARLAKAAMALAALVLAVVFALINPRFATLPNLVALVEQNAALAIVAVGATMGIVSRTIDIAPGSAIALGRRGCRAWPRRPGCRFRSRCSAGVAAYVGRLCRQRQPWSAASGSIR